MKRMLPIFAALALTLTASAQEGADEPHVAGGFQPDAQTQELIDLFKAVDTKLRAIDTLLFDMGAGERPLEAPKDSGLGDLLKLTREASVQVVDDIDRILELAEQMAQQQQQQQSSSSSSSQQQQQSGQQQQQPEGQQQPDQNPGEQSQGEPDKPEGQEPNGEQENQPGGEQDQPQDQQDQQGKDPQGNQENEGTPQNQQSGSQGQHSTGAGSQAERTDRWGELPERVRETFRNQGGDNAPLYYRDWIDSYYRHLNKQDG